MRASWVGIAVGGGTLACAGLEPDPGPWSGDAPIDVGLEANAPTAERDGPRIAARLAHGGADITVRVDGPDRLSLSGNAAGPQVVAPVLTRGALAIGPPGAGLTNAHVRRASTAPDAFDGRLIVTVELTDEGGARFCQLTRGLVGSALDVSVDGAVVMSPIVREAICGGRLQIHPGTVPDGPEHDPNALAALLSTEPLDADWTIATIR